MTDQSQPPRGIDRRKLKRTVTRVPASFEAGELRGRAYVKNVSKGGVFLRTETLPPTGSAVRVLFHTREGCKVEVTGTVVWTTEELGIADARPGFGVRFGDDSTAYRRFYEQILLY